MTSSREVVPRWTRNPSSCSCVLALDQVENETCLLGAELFWLSSFLPFLFRKRRHNNQTMAASGTVTGCNKKKCDLWHIRRGDPDDHPIRGPLLDPQACVKRKTPRFGLIRHLSTADNNVDLLRTCDVAGKQSDTATATEDPTHRHSDFICL